eukprot:SM003982S15162  [mRNA]  locus=s3982:13:911:- [translate_table: standard]
MCGAGLACRSLDARGGNPVYSKPLGRCIAAGKFCAGSQRPALCMVDPCAALLRGWGGVPPLGCSPTVDNVTCYPDGCAGGGVACVPRFFYGSQDVTTRCAA